jgi:Cohesin domain
MKAFKRLILIVLVCLLLVPTTGATAYASSGTISLSDPTAKIGESVSVTVKITATGSETIKSVDMNLTYDQSALEFESGTQATGENGTVQLSGTADSAIKTYTLNFKALKGSTSSIKITDYDIKDSNDSAVEVSKVGSSTVTISGDESSNPESETLDSTTQDVQATETQTEENKIVTPPKKDVEVEIAGTSFNVCKIPQDIIPEGFEYIGYMYQGKAVDALKKDSIILFYLNQTGEESVVFYVYDEQTGGFSIYAPVNSTLNYTVVNLDEDVTIPEGFTETEVSIGGVAVSAWQSGSNSEYYLLYLMNSEGTKNLYLYDIVEKTVQRYYYTSSDSTGETTDSYQTMYTELNENYNKDMQSRMRLVYIFLVLTVILVFVIINLVFRLMDKKHAVLDEDEEDDEDILYEEFDVSEKKVTDKNKKNSLFGSFKNEENTLDDDYEDDYEDELEEEIDKKTKREMKKAAKLEKKEKAKRDKELKSKKDNEDDEFENSEDDFDDSDDFELQIFDLDDK